MCPITRNPGQNRQKCRFARAGEWKPTVAGLPSASRPRTNWRFFLTVARCAEFVSRIRDSPRGCRRMLRTEVHAPCQEAAPSCPQSGVKWPHGAPAWGHGDAHAGAGGPPEVAGKAAVPAAPWPCPHAGALWSPCAALCPHGAWVWGHGQPEPPHGSSPCRHVGSACPQNHPKCPHFDGLCPHNALKSGDAGPASGGKCSMEAGDHGT